MHSCRRSHFPVARSLPQSWERYLKISGILVYGFDKEAQGITRGIKILLRKTWATVPDSFWRGGRQYAIKYNQPLSSSHSSKYYEPGESGDSSNPSLIILNSSPVLLSVTTSGGWSGAFLPHYIDEIESAMLQLDMNSTGDQNLTQPEHPLSFVDLSGYQSLSQ